MTKRMDTTRYRFSDYVLEVEGGRLRCGGDVLPLQRLPMRVLLCLVSRAGELCSREELRQVLTNDGTAASDATLNFCIRRIRVVLGDDHRQARFVETRPRWGYRFIAPVARCEASGERGTTFFGSAKEAIRSPFDRLASFAAAAFVVACRRSIPSLRRVSAFAALALALGARPTPPLDAVTTSGSSRLAVLPFESLSDDPDRRRLAHELTRGVRASLAKLEASLVTAPPATAGAATGAAASPRAAGREGSAPSAPFVVEGTLREGVRREGDQHVRLTVKLVRTRDRQPILIEDFESDPEQLALLDTWIATLLVSKAHGATSEPPAVGPPGESAATGAVAPPPALVGAVGERRDGIAG